MISSIVGEMTCVTEIVLSAMKSVKVNLLLDIE